VRQEKKRDVRSGCDPKPERFYVGNAGRLEGIGAEGRQKGKEGFTPALSCGSEL